MIVPKLLITAPCVMLIVPLIQDTMAPGSMERTPPSRNTPNKPESMSATPPGRISTALASLPAFREDSPHQQGTRPGQVAIVLESEVLGGNRVGGALPHVELIGEDVR